MIKQIKSSEIKNFLIDNKNVELLDVRTQDEWDNIGRPDGERLGLITHFVTIIRSPDPSANKEFIDGSFGYWVLRVSGSDGQYHQFVDHNLAAGVYADMLDRDVSKFDATGVAPHTIYRDMMSNAADRPVNDYVRERFTQGAFPFNRDLLTTVELFDWLRASAKVRVGRENEVANALKDIGGVRKRD